MTPSHGDRPGQSAHKAAPSARAARARALRLRAWALRQARWVEAPLLPSTPVPLVTRGALEITAVSALFVGRGPQVLMGGGLPRCGE